MLECLPKAPKQPFLRMRSENIGKISPVRRDAIFLLTRWLGPIINIHVLF